jgi:hypothetical protein
MGDHGDDITSTAAATNNTGGALSLVGSLHRSIKAVAQSNPHGRKIPFLVCIIITVLMFYYADSPQITSALSQVSAVVASTVGGGNAVLSVRDEESRFENPYSTKALACMTKDEYQRILSVIRASKQDIWDRWQVSTYPRFLHMMGIPKLSWQLQESKFVKLILERNMSAHTSTYMSAPFVVGFSGSSVTAGHDSFFKEAYPNTFYEAMLPAFEALRIPLVVRNQALGNNPCYPYDACLATHMGDDLDVLTWEQSMNCGRDPKPLESFTRAASVMPKKPTLIYILSGTPAWTSKDCNGTTEYNRTSSLVAEEKLLLSTSLQVSTSLSTMLPSMTFLKPTPTSQDLSQIYSGLAPMGQVS